MDARVRQKERDLPDQAGQVGSRLPDPEHGSDRGRADSGGELLRRALAPVLTQRMGNLVPHHGRDLVVRRLELLEDAGVKRDLATGHAPRVDLRRGEDVTSHFQPGASFRNTPVCGMMRLAMARTRSTCCASRLTLPFGLCSWSTFW